MNRKNKKYLCGLLPAIALMLLAACNSGAEKGADEQDPSGNSTPVDVFLLKKGRLSSSIRIPGELIAYQQVDLYAKVNSFVKKLSVDVGSEVAAGQLLAVMEAPELSAQLDASASRLKSQEAIYLASKANYDRLYETSQTPGTVSQNDLDQASAKKSSDLAQLEALKSAYKEVMDTRDYLEIRAPFSGVITARNVNAGAYVGPSGKGSELPLFTLQEQKKLRLVVSIPEIYTGFLNNRVSIQFKVGSQPDKTFTASVNRLAGALDNKLRSERVEMDVANPDKKLLPGMVAQVILPLPAGDSTFIIPKTALVNSTQAIFVVKVSDSVFRWVPVQTGREDDQAVEVYGQLAAGDTLVSVANDEIRNGSARKNIRVGK
jgi:membrane fusion protein, multidrug efflux system